MFPAIDKINYKKEPKCAQIRFVRFLGVKETVLEPIGVCA